MLASCGTLNFPSGDLILMTEPNHQLQAMSDPPPINRQDAVISTVKLSWADIEEQYDSMFGRYDFEANVMGVPPPPDEWITPKKTARRRQATEADTLLETTNSFTNLGASAERRPVPSALRPERRPSTARPMPLSRCSSD